MFTISNHTPKRYGRFFKRETAEKFLEKKGYYLPAGLTVFVKSAKGGARKGGNLFKVAKVVELLPEEKPLNRELFT